jgi:uncharacterized damage-inducible protein DinB
MIDDFLAEYRRYRAIGEKALAQVSDEALNRIPAADGNSIAMVVRHMGGNLASRFTNLLTEDGEKPWRDRDAEFETRAYTREEVESWWRRGWDTVEREVAALTAARLGDTIHIRRQPLTVHAALCRSLAHVAYHVGQIVLLARMGADAEWKWISIPKGGSDAYNADPEYEKA